MAYSLSLPLYCALRLGLLVQHHHRARYSEVYADYAYFAVFPFLVDFIDGWFSSNTLAVIIPVAIGQGLIALGMMLGGRWQRFAAIGAMTFFVAVMPLGIGSAFPATLLMGIGAFFLMKNATTQRTPAAP
ncbi:MAG: hypothetical protein IPP80_12990 [Ignavibacteria bacterium]|nr:hypothetical protein [Ignavibacteria bacterium]